MRQTTILKQKDVKKNWFIIDAEGRVLGRLASFVASYLRGKNKLNFTPNVDCGDYIVVINAAKVILTGNKEKDKIYYRHSQYPGGLKKINVASLRRKKPIAILEKAIKGMLPHTKLGNQQRKHLFVYPGVEHKHLAQKPRVLEVK